MKVRRSMETQDRDLSRVIGCLAGIIAVVGALGLPTVYFAVGYRAMGSALEMEAKVYSREMNGIVAANPDMWEFETVRIMGVLERRLGEGEGDSRRILDGGGNQIAATVEPVPWPALLRSHPILESGRHVGTVEVNRTHEELVERILHAGLAYADAVDPETSLVVCNAPDVESGKGFQARELGVPTVSDELFMERIGTVAGGTGLEEFVAADGQQFALF
jgi:hypothetical protein